MNDVVFVHVEDLPLSLSLPHEKSALCGWKGRTDIRRQSVRTASRVVQGLFLEPVGSDLKGKFVSVVEAAIAIWCTRAFDLFSHLNTSLENSGELIGISER